MQAFRVLLCIFLAGFWNPEVSLSRDSDPVRITNGEVDLRDWVMQKQPSLKLEGAWRFVPQKFLSADDALGLSPETGYLTRIPGPWTQAEGQPAGAHPKAVGWGTYVLRLKNFHQLQQLIGITMRVDTAYKALLFKEDDPGSVRVIASVGKPGPDKASSIPQIGDALGRFWLDQAGDYILLIHVSNFHWYNSGIWGTPTIGDYEVLARARSSQWLSDVFVLGMLIIMMFYNLSLYLHRKEDHIALWLAGYIATHVARLLGMSCLAYHIFPGPHDWVYEISRKLELGPANLSTVFIASFLYLTFAKDRRSTLLRYYFYFAVAFAFLHLVTDAAFYSKFIIISQLLPLILGSFFMLVVVKEAIKGTPAARVSLLGLVALYLTTVFDVLAAMQLINSTVYILPYGLCILNFCQSQVIAIMFAKAFRTAEALSQNLQKEVARQTREIRTMLDHIPEGIFTIVSPGVIHPNFSAYMNRIFKSEAIAGKRATDVLFKKSTLNQDQISRIESTIDSSLNEAVMAFEMNADSLVKEVEIRADQAEPQQLQVSWNPITDQNEQVEKILVTLKDVTELKKLEKANIDQQKELEYISEIVSVSKEKFEQFIDMSHRFIEENQRLIDQNKDCSPEILKILFINMHTIKGTARSYGFNKMTGVLHEVEQSYSVLLKQGHSAWDQKNLSDNLHRARNLISIYDRISTTKLGRSKNAASKILLERTFLENNINALHRIDFSKLDHGDLAIFEQLLRSFDEVCYERAVEVFEDILSLSERLAKDLDKEKPVIHVVDPGFRINYAAQQLFRNIFVHIVRNSLDHGIEKAKERIEKGKKPTGTIDVNLSLKDNRMIIQYRDDGRGLNLKALREVGLQKGWLDPRVDHTPQQIAELIFQAGLTTCTTVSEISGRGIGMDAVRRYLTAEGGDIQAVLIKPIAAGAFYEFRFEISLPQRLFTLTENAPSPELPKIGALGMKEVG